MSNTPPLLALFAACVFVAVWWLCVRAVGRSRELREQTGRSTGIDGDSPSANNVGRGPTRRYTGAFLLWSVPALLVTVGGLAVYLQVGDPGAELVSTVADAFDEPIDSEQLDDAIKRLRARVDSIPADSTSWALLVRALLLDSDHAGAVAAHRQAELADAVSKSADVDAIQAMLALSEGKPTREIDRVLTRAWQTAPDDPMVLELKWFSASVEGEHEEAVAYLERALRQQVDPDARRRMQDSAAFTRGLLSQDRPRVDVEVLVLASPAEARWLLVFARTSVDEPPVAAGLRPYEGPDVYRVTLDEASAMNLEAWGAGDAPLKVSARLSRTQDIVAHPSDLERESDWVNALDAPRVMLEFLGGGSHATAVGVSARTGIEVGPEAAVFVVARGLGDDTVPLAAEKIPFRLLPTYVVLDERDSMLPGKSVLGVDRIEVFARLVPSGKIGAGSEEFESDRVQTIPGKSVRLRIQHPVETKPIAP